MCERMQRSTAETVRTDANVKSGAKAATGEKAKTSEKVEVNVDELAARIAGSNLGFRTLESDLDEKGTWDAARLGPLAERLKILVTRRNDLRVFRGLVPSGERSSVGSLRVAADGHFRTWGPHFRGPHTGLRRGFQGDRGGASGRTKSFGRPLPPAGGVGREVAASRLSWQVGRAFLPALSRQECLPRRFA